METTIKSKRVSYGQVELKDGGTLNPRYRIYLNGSLKETSNDKNTIVSIFDKNYH